MTVSETLLYIQTLLDDRSFDFFTFRIAAEAVHQAQLMVIQQAIQTNEERCLRPLYSTDVPPPLSADDFNGTSALPNDYLHARGLDIYALLGDDVTVAPIGTARYIRPGEFLSLTSAPSSSFSSSRVINNYSWTINGGYYIFSRPQRREFARLHYIRKPRIFGSQIFVGIGESLRRQPIELPKEYHVKVASIAAELLNDLDTLEQERENLSTEGYLTETNK
jgi:hypothetical protein